MKKVKGLAIDSTEKVEDKRLAEVIVQRIEQLLKERHISKYRLSKLTEIEMPSMTTLFNGTNAPSMATLSRICEALNMSYAEFFDLGVKNIRPVSYHDRRLLSEWHKLNYDQKRLLYEFTCKLQNENDKV